MRGLMQKKSPAAYGGGTTCFVLFAILGLSSALSWFSGAALAQQVATHPCDRGPNPNPSIEEARRIVCKRCAQYRTFNEFSRCLDGVRGYVSICTQRGFSTIAGIDQCIENEQLANDRALADAMRNAPNRRCDSYGFKRGTDAFAQCLQRKQQHEEQLRALRDAQSDDMLFQLLMRPLP